MVRASFPVFILDGRLGQLVIECEAMKRNIPMRNPPNQKAQDKVEGQSAATPLPAATRAAFSITPEIPVGNFKVRRFLDGDIDNLEGMDHPFGKLIVAVMSGEKESKNTFVPRGKWAWILCWMMTRPIEEVDAVIAEKGIKGITEEAAKVFRKSTFGDLAAVVQAVIEQFNVYCAPVLGYGAKNERKT